MASRNDDFLSRWSRRKTQAKGGGLRRKDEAKPSRPAPAQPPQAPEKSAGEAGTRKAALAEPELSFADELRREEEMPVAAVNRTPAARDDAFEDLTDEQREEFADVDFDALTPDSDFTRFMKEGVPEIIRRRALRALWSHPVLASVDRLNDYDQDFTDAAMAIKIVGSNYKPGSGYLTDEERARYNLDESEAPEEVARAGESDETEAKTAEADDTGDGEDEDETAMHDEPRDDESEGDEVAGADDGAAPDGADAEVNEKS